MGSVRTLVLLTGLVGLGTGCGVDVVHLEVVESGHAGGSALSFPGMNNFGSSLGAALGDKEVNPDDVDSMKVTQVTLALTSQGGLTDDLAFIHSLAFLVSAQGMEPSSLASKDSFADEEREVQMDTADDLELKPFLQAGSMKVTVDARLAYPPPDLVELEVTFKIRVDVNVI